MTKIRAVIKYPDCNPVVMLIDRTPEAIDRQVGGMPKAISFGEDLYAFVNGKADRFQIEPNVRYLGKQIYGPVVFTARTPHGVDGLSEDQAEQIRQMIKKK